MTIEYLPSSTDVTKNLVDADFADMTGDVTNTLGGKMRPGNCRYDIASAKHITVMIVWSELTGTLDAVLQVKTTQKASLGYVNENPDESTSNPTQVTLNSVAGIKQLHFYPANYTDIQLFLDKNGVTGGTIDVVVLFKF